MDCVHCRDDARTVYVAMVQELGSQYLKFAISVLRSALPPRGYMAHVQGYTVHAVLQAVMQVLRPLTFFELKTSPLYMPPKPMLCT